MTGKTCFFIGSRYSDDRLTEQLVEAIEYHILVCGVTEFIVGHYGGFDSLVARVLKEEKKLHSDIKIFLLEPYALNQKREVPVGFNGTIYPEGLEFVPKRYAIVKANTYIIQNSDYLIAYPGVGNSRKIVEYAKRRERKGLIKVTLL